MAIRYANWRGGLLSGTSSADILWGRAANDTIKGLDGTDYLYGGYGDDSMYGGAGTDFLRGEAGSDRLFGEAGTDFLRGGSGTDTMYGGSGTDSLLGEAGNDWLYGGSGTDHLKGGAGIDVVQGGTGSDLLSGGQDADYFVFRATDGIYVDTVEDFRVGQDKLVLGDGLQAVAAETLREDVNFDGTDDTVLTLTNSSTIILLGVDMGQDWSLGGPDVVTYATFDLLT